MNYQDLLKEEREKRDKIRIQNLQELVSRYGSVKALAVAVSRSPAQIGNMLRGVKPFGDSIKEHIEKTLDLEPGHLDRRAKTLESRSISPTIKMTRVPLLSTVQAGMPTDQGDICFDEYIEVPGELSHGCYALRVNGDSMSPLIDDGDVVIVDPSRWPKPGDCIVARSELENLSEVTVKRYYPIGFDEEGRETYEARPFNEVYPIMNSVDQRLVIIGTVCKLIKDM